MIQVAREPKALLFDCDGVLVDSTPLHLSAFLSVLRPFGISALDYSRIAGLSTRESFALLARSHGLNLSAEDLEVLTRRKQEEFTRLSEAAGTEVYPCWKDLFAQLRRRFRIGVVSSGSRASLDRALKKCGISAWVEIHLSAADVSKTKPDPEPYREACRRLEVAPKEALVFEDARSGIESAIAAGCGVVGFRIRAPQGTIGALPEILDWAKGGESA